MIDLERHIEILLLSNDCVIVPGLGGFMTHHVEARYDETDGCFLPPLRTLGFNPQLTLNDSLLVHSYIEAYDISYPEALRRIESEVNELRQHLEADGQYELNDIGVLSLNEEGNLQFEPCESGILTPQFYGLGAFEMEPVAGHATKPATDEQTAESDRKPADHAIVIKMSWLRNIAAVAAAVISFLMIGSPVSNSTAPVSHAQQSAFFPIAAQEQPSATTLQPVEAEEEAIVAEPAGPVYAIVLASQTTMRHAEDFVALLADEGYDEARVNVNKNRVVRVVYGSFASEEEAQTELRQLRSANRNFRQGWIMKMEPQSQAPEER